MTAVRSKEHLMELAAQRLPVPSVEVVRLIEENRRMREALTFISKTDDFDNALDPERNKRTAKAALNEVEES